ncbi:MAG: NAD(P)-dependent oxidoreductase [Gordonia sp. (in: high G+C Gram-positive bacteria)]
MRILIAGGTGVLGRAIIPLLVAGRHEVAATTRAPAKTALVRDLGATPVVADAFSRETLNIAIADTQPEVVIHLLTDLTSGNSASNARLRTVGTRSLVDAAKAHQVPRIVAESISWIYPPGSTPATETDPLDLNADEPRHTTISGVDALESAVRELPHSVVLRLGQLYGPGTWYAPGGRFAADAHEGRLPATPTVASLLHIDDAAAAVADALTWDNGTYNIVDDDPAPGTQWVPRFATSVGAPLPAHIDTADIGRPVSNAAARAAGLTLRYPSWRDGFFVR